MNWRSRLILLMACLAGLGHAGGTLAAAKVASAGANWSTATWTPAGVPTASDTCTINSGVNLTVTTAAVCGSLALGNATGTGTTLTLGAGGSLNITSSGGQSGNLVMNPGNVGVTFTIAAATRTLTVDGTVTWSATTGTHVISVSTGQINFTRAAGIAWPARGTLTVTGNNAGGSVNFTGLVTQTGGTIQNTTAGGTLNFNAGFTKSGGTFTTRSGETINFNGSLAVSGGGLTFNTASTVNFTSTATITPTSAITFGNLAIGPGAGNTVTLAGNVGVAGNLTVNTGTFALATFTANRSAAGGTITVANGATLNIGGTNGFPANYSTHTLGVTSTVAYSGTNQTVSDETTAGLGYGNLSLSGGGTKTMPLAVQTVRGNFTMSGTAAAALNNDLTIGGNFNIGAGTSFDDGGNALNVAGNLVLDGTLTSTGVVTLNGGAAVQTISGSGASGNPPDLFTDLTVSNAGITLARNVTVTNAITGTVTLTSTCPTDYTLTSNGGTTVAHSCPTVVNSINCPVSCAATSAATVSWTVTFNNSVTGVDATAFSLAASGLSGAYITTVTGSGTTWTVTANTGIGSGTLGLNQTGPGSVVPTLTGTFTGQVYTISATPALAEYRMDEASWNGTANEVVDSSGSGNNAQSFNSANTTDGSRAIAGSPGTCRYGVFDNGSTITQGYVQTPLPNLTTDFTVTAWIRTTNNAAAGQRILIDDQNNTGGYGVSLGDGAAGIIRFYSRGITPVILDSTYTIANNTWYFVAAVADITNKKRTIYVFNSAGTLLNSTTEAAWTGGTWGTDAGPVSIGGEVNGPPQTEPPASFHFRGNLDEVRVYQKVLSQSALAAIATQTHACPVNVPDHLVIQSSGSGLTCAASTLTVLACQDATCATPYTLGVSGTLSATGAGMTVNWDGTTGGAAGAGFVIPNGSSSVAKNVQVATAGSVVFGVSSATPTPINPTTCNFGTPVCTFTANTAGFIFSDTSSPGNAYTIVPQVSGIAAPAVYLRAVQASTTNAAVCTPAIIGQTTAVNMGYVCNNPAACQAGNLTTINATAIAPGGTSVNLTFDANGSAPVTARYDDVGQITLNASKTVTPFAGATAIALNGSSNAFVVAPHHFGFSSVTAAPIKAGTAFSATVTAYNGLGTPTATGNFGKETAAEGVTLSSIRFQPTGPGASNGSFSGTVGSFNNGAATGTNLNWSEVGSIDLTATLASGSYLGSGITATGTTGVAGAVGRFIPDHFDTVVTESCVTGAFTYSGQPFTVQVTAMNGAGTPATTVNYDGSVNTSPNFSKAVTLSDASAAGVGSLAPTAVTFSAFAAGVASPTPAYSFTSATTVPTTIALRAVDTDSVTSSGHAEGSAVIRSGRLRLQNANGSELLNLPVDLKLQYWAGTTGWLTNSLDTCTSIAAANFAFSFPADPKNLLAACETAVTVSGSAPNYTISLAKPGAGNAGWTDLILNLDGTAAGNQCTVVGGPGGAPTNANAAWLRYNWTGAGPNNPTARATFGVYKSGPVIHRREMY